MSRYRKIEVKTWTDRKFRELSPMPPSGQSLWLYLMCGPHTSPIPGLFRAGRAALAEELGWAQEAFDKAFGEVLEKGMAKADFAARLVWLPKALAHNKPESPNVVRSWRVELDLLPECELKNIALADIAQRMEELGDAYYAAFCEITGAPPKPKGKTPAKASAKASAKATPNQEQEQEQEQQQEQEELSGEADASPSPPASPAAGDGSSEVADKQAKAEAKALRLAKVTDEAIAAYNASPLVKPNGGLLATVSTKVGRETRQQQVARCIQTARAICEEDFASDTIIPAFWIEYFNGCHRDEHKSGRLGGGKGHESWLPDFEFLTRKDVMLAVYTKLASEGAAAEGGEP